MSDSSRPTDALLTEHFRYTPLSLIDEIINAVNTIIYRALEAIENGLFSIPPATLGFAANSTSAEGNAHGNTDRDESGGGGGGSANEGAGVGGGEFKEEIENGVHRLETLLEATVDKTFDRFEIFTLRNILTVPDDLGGWMRLTHYENLTLPTPASAPTPESILQLRRKLQATKSLNLALRSQHTRNAALLTSLRSILNNPTPSSPSTSTSPSSNHPSSLSFLTQHPPFASTSNPSEQHQHHQQQPLTHQATSATAHLPALRALLADLRPRLETLRAAAARGEQDRDRDRDSTTREERRMYIESRVRKVVGAAGDEEGGDGGGGGPRVAESEIVGLEGIVRGFEGGGGN